MCRPNFALGIIQESGLEAFSQLLQIGSFFSAGRVDCCGCHQGNWAQPTDLLHPFVHLLSQYPQGVFAMRVPTFGARRDVKRYSAPQIG